MTTTAIRNPVRLQCLGEEEASAFAAAVQQECGAPTRVDCADVVLPGDQPGLLFHILDYALTRGYATDSACSSAIGQMEAGLPR